MDVSKVTITLYLDQDERDELLEFSEAHRRRVKLGRLYADGVLARIRDFKRGGALAQPTPEESGPALRRVK